MQSQPRPSMKEHRQPDTPVPVRVCVRLRPCSKDSEPCIRGLDSRSLELVNWRNAKETFKYQFDTFYGDTATQQDVYCSSVQPILHHLLQGQNASVLAYGPTGAGKTHTMLGSPQQPGVIPRAVRDILHMVREAGCWPDGHNCSYSVSMSYLEVYQEKVLDLLEPSGRDLVLRETPDHSIMVTGLTERELSSFHDFEKHFLSASRNRTVASTGLNSRSSRSHAALVLRVAQSRPLVPARSAKLQLVDLAGCEDNRLTGNCGLRLRESSVINTSLLVLGKVVDALRLGQPRVPYRDSKLTRLLQDSLGGSAHSVVIAHVAPEQRFYFDTLTTLNFATRSKQVVNKPFAPEALPEPAAEKTLQKENSGKQKQSTSKEGPLVAEKPLGALLPLDQLEPSLVQRVLRLEELERQQGAGHRGLPLLGTPKAERKALLRCLEETQAELEMRQQQKELEAKELLRAASMPEPPQAIILPMRQVPIPQKRAPPTEDEGILVLKRRSGPGGTENAVPSWELTRCQELTVRGHQKLLELLNHGSTRELLSLKRIGPRTAELIMAWREQHGPFVTLQDLQRMETMTAKKVATLIKANTLDCIQMLLPPGPSALSLFS
ncbi:kinesin-like protein KIF22 isoform X2 [Alligator mississippiensis]|uniref:kinesin-like protein KIF22 isoform X2 n=1 Tax=Alligator mississippiensis TaxID=8496 RepID=UPI00287753BF|nr:kinesin-like protein KIF22 isoform X2 [Alligator mississippiensis]